MVALCFMSCASLRLFIISGLLEMLLFLDRLGDLLIVLLKTFSLECAADALMILEVE